jgi:hypothetical protein
MSLIVVYDPEVERLLYESKTDPDAAAKLLLVASKYIQLERKMPPELSTYLCQAIDGSMGQELSKRPKALAYALGILKRGAPHKNEEYSDLEIAQLYREELSKGLTHEDAQWELEIKYEINGKKAWRAYNALAKEEEMNKALDEIQDWG